MKNWQFTRISRWKKQKLILETGKSFNNKRFILKKWECKIKMYTKDVYFSILSERKLERGKMALFELIL